MAEPISSSSTCRKVIDPDFHFFSDTELTAGPNDSRPTSPMNIEAILSDTEFEVKSREFEVKSRKGKYFFIQLRVWKGF